MWDYLGRIRDVLKTIILFSNWVNTQTVDSIFEHGLRALNEYLAALNRYDKLVTEFRALIPKDPMTDCKKVMK